MTIKAIEKYGYHEEADAIAERVISQQLAAYRNIEPHTIWECYSPSGNTPSTEHGRRARPGFCGWSAWGRFPCLLKMYWDLRRCPQPEKKCGGG